MNEHEIELPHYHEQTQMSMYDKISDPMAAAEKMGEWFAISGMFGCNNKIQGTILALACLCERKSPFDIKRTYHLINGDLSKRHDAMLADFNRAGGQHHWEKSDSTEAIIVLNFRNHKDVRIKYTMEDAIRAKLVKAGGSYEKNPDAMLRARVVSKGLRMIAPEIVQGIYTPEEVQDFTSESVPEKKLDLKQATPATIAEPAKAAPAPQSGESRKVQPADAPPPAPAAATSTLSAPENVEALEVLLKGHEADANIWLVNKGWLQPLQNFRQLSAENVQKILARPDPFLRAIKPQPAEVAK